MTKKTPEYRVILKNASQWQAWMAQTMWNLQGDGNWDITCGLELYPGDPEKRGRPEEGSAMPSIDSHPHAKREILDKSRKDEPRYISELSPKDWIK